MSDRTEGDTRANAMSFANISVDPTGVTTDLRDVRAAIKQELRTLRETPDDSLQLAWLASFTPKRALKRMFDAMPADPDLSVLCSNLGDVGSVVSASMAPTPSSSRTSGCPTRKVDSGLSERAAK